MLVSLENHLIVSMGIIPYNACSQAFYNVKSHEVMIEGTSNLQSWTAEITELTGQFTLKVENGKILEVQDARISIDAGSIEGSEGRRMNTKIYETLDTRNNPQISFVLREVNSLAENPGTFIVESRGVITIAGVSRNIPLRAVGRVLPTGTQNILMSDHRMTPPTALLGALRTGDAVVLNYKVVLNKNK